MLARFVENLGPGEEDVLRQLLARTTQPPDMDIVAAR